MRGYYPRLCTATLCDRARACRVSYTQTKLRRGQRKANFMNEMEQKVLKTLSHQYKTQAAASTEIINLQSILNLPKGTEHFLTDIHGEYEQFNQVDA